MMRSCNNRANSCRNYQTNHYKCQSLSISPGDKEGGLLVLVLLLLRHLSFRQYGLLPPAKEVLCLSVHLCQDISLLSLSFKGRNILIIKSKAAHGKYRRSIKVLLLHHCSSWLFPPQADLKELNTLCKSILLFVITSSIIMSFPIIVIAISIIMETFVQVCPALDRAQPQTWRTCLCKRARSCRNDSETL